MLVMKNLGSSVLILQWEIKYLEARTGPGAGLHVEQECLVNWANLALDRVWQILEDALVLHGHLVYLVGAELLQPGYVYRLELAVEQELLAPCKDFLQEAHRGLVVARQMHCAS